MITHNLIQGSAEWHSHRKNFRNASDAPAMLGLSPYKSRSQLLHELKTGITPEVDDFTQRRFNDGHRAEALARPIAEKIIGEELSPVVGTEGDLSASFDGMTFIGDVIFEHKLLARRLEELVWVSDNAEDFLPEDYLVQMEQQLHVSGAEKCLFMASKWTDEGAMIEERHCWYYPNMARRQRISDGWALFKKDLDAYVPEPVAEKAVAAEVEAFPVPSIQVKGELVACNLSEITPKFDKYLAETKTELVTDQDFADGEANAKASREAAKTLKLTAKAVIDQITPISEAVRTLEGYAAKFDALGLKLEKAVKEQKEAIKTAAILKARNDFNAHIEQLEAETKPIRLNLAQPDFAGAVKGVKTIKSLHSNIADELARCKAAAEGTARDIRAKLAWCKTNAEGYGMLFPDLQQIIGKEMDDFQLVIKTRIDEHKRAEAEKEARIKAEAEEKKNIPEGDGITQEPRLTPQEAAKRIAAARLPEKTETGNRIKLGDINSALGFTVSGDFLASLGWPAVAKDKSALLYREIDFPAICGSIVEHIAEVSSKHQFKKAA